MSSRLGGAVGDSGEYDAGASVMQLHISQENMAMCIFVMRVACLGIRFSIINILLVLSVVSVVISWLGQGSIAKRLQLYID